MELDELKSLWKEENKKLKDRVEVNEKLIQKMNLDKVVSEFDKLLKWLILGRNFALFHFCLSVILSILVLKEWVYSIPCLLGGFAMLWSFMYHEKIKQLNYHQYSVIDLQKTICEIRIHIAKTAKSDISIVLFWLWTVVPIIIKITGQVSIYSDFKYFAIFCLGMLLYTIFTIYGSKNVYKDYDIKLRNAEMSLNEISEFEKTG